MGNYVVTFARGFGSGGKEIASKLAKELGIHCYENRILTLASQLSGLSEHRPWTGRGAAARRWRCTAWPSR